MADKLFTITEAAAISGINRTTLSRNIQKLNIPTIKRGGKTFLDQSTLDQYFPSATKTSLAKTLAFVNQKGGPGKTTTCLNLAIALSKLSYKLLVIDFDPQANLSGQFIDPDTLKFTVTNVLKLAAHDFATCQLSEALIKTEFFDLLPSNISLARFDVSRDFMDTDRISEFIKTVQSSYDYILIDCPPTLDIKLMNALAAANLAIIPSLAAQFSIQGMKDLKRSIESVRQRNTTLKTRVLINRFIARRQANVVIDNLGELFPVLNSKIPEAAGFEKAQLLKGSHANTIEKAKFESYMNLGREVVKCLE